MTGRLHQSRCSGNGETSRILQGGAARWQFARAVSGLAKLALELLRIRRSFVRDAVKNNGESRPPCRVHTDHRPLPNSSLLRSYGIVMVGVRDLSPSVHRPVCAARGLMAFDAGVAYFPTDIRSHSTAERKSCGKQTAMSVLREEQSSPGVIGFATL